MSAKLALAFVLVAVTATAAACFTPEEREVKYQNETSAVLMVSSDGTRFTLQPGETEGFRTRKNFLPDHVQAYDEQGNLRFDEVITWEELEANGFRVVIR